ncbi:magnesium chelatase subunit ChlI family protein, partial [Bacillus benzoevorans]
LNNRVPFQLIQDTSPISNQQMQYLHQICWENKWSNRTQIKIIRVARTISDLFEETSISEQALKEAIEWKMFSNHFMNGEKDG